MSEVIENIPGKFNEALTELLSFSYFTQENNKSFALLQFEELKNQNYFSASKFTNGMHFFSSLLPYSKITNGI